MLLQHKIHKVKSDHRQSVAIKSWKLTIVLGLFHQINCDDHKVDLSIGK